MAQNADSLAQRGRALFDAPGSCWACHGDHGEGRVGPSLQYGPSPFEINYQFQTNPQMGPLAAALSPTPDDMLALAVYIKSLGGALVTNSEIEKLRATLDDVEVVAEYTGFPLSAYDRQVQEIERFSTVLSQWERKSQTGSIRKEYEVEVVATFEPGEPKFDPQPGRTYFYENTGTSRTTFVTDDGSPVGAESTQVVVGDAATKEIIAYYQLPFELRGGRPHYSHVSGWQICLHHRLKAGGKYWCFPVRSNESAFGSHPAQGRCRNAAAC